jgi:hypothetical protein
LTSNLDDYNFNDYEYNYRVRRGDKSDNFDIYQNDENYIPSNEIDDNEDDEYQNDESENNKNDFLIERGKKNLNLCYKIYFAYTISILLLHK